jgi:hypothetical protein
VRAREASAPLPHAIRERRITMNATSQQDAGHSARTYQPLVEPLVYAHQLLASINSRLRTMCKPIGDNGVHSAQPSSDFRSVQGLQHLCRRHKMPIRSTTCCRLKATKCSVSAEVTPRPVNWQSRPFGVLPSPRKTHSGAHPPPASGRKKGARCKSVE